MTLAIGTRVRVHRNLTRGDWVVCTDTSKRTILGYVDDVVLTDVTFRVSEAARTRVVRTGHREVHAQAVGTLESWNTSTALNDPVLPCCQRDAADCDCATLTYNPHRCGSFTVDGQPVQRAQRVHFHGAHGTAAGAA